MRFGLSVPPFTDPSVVVAMATDAEAAGWDGFFLWDHLLWDGQVEVHDPWVLLGAIAQATASMRLGTMVTPLSRRRPGVLAKHLVTLDHLSVGRAVLGVGLGDPPDLDFSDFGDEPDARARAAILDESLAVLGGLLGDGHADHHGTHLSVTTTMRPAPLQQPRIPIWVAGRHPFTRPLARSKQWDGYVPIARDLLSPDELAGFVGDHPSDDWDLVAQWQPGVPADEFADAGATWLIRSTWPHEDGWLADFRGVIADGPV